MSSNIKTYTDFSKDLKSEDSKYSEWGPWSECKKQCGYDSSFRFREVIPPIYGGKNVHANVKESDLFESKDCNKFCRTEAEVLTKWKEFTLCSKSSMPDIVNEKTLSYIDDEDGMSKTVDNPHYIDNLRLVEEDILLNLFKSWRPAIFSTFSSECYGNELLNGGTMFIGSKIYSKTGASYLEYGESGYFSLFNMDAAGKYNSAYEFRSSKTGSSIGDYMKFIGNKLTFFNTTGVVLDSITVPGEECKIVVNDYNLLFIEQKKGSVNLNYIMSVVGKVPNEYVVGSDILKFKSNPSGEYKILSNVDSNNYLSIHKTGVRLVNNSIVIWEIKDKLNCYVEISSVGFYVKNSNNGIEFKIETVGLNVVSLYGENLEFYDKSEYLMGYWGTKMSIISESYIIRRPQTDDESKNINFMTTGGTGKISSLNFQKDGNLVYYIDKVLVWSSNTTNIPSTHFCLKAGEMLIMNNSSIVWKSNSNIPSSVSSKISTMIIILEEWVLLTVKFSDIPSNEALNIVRMYPNCQNIESASMKNIVGRYIEENYKKYPLFSIKAKSHTNAKPTGYKISKNVIDISNYLNSIKYSNCPPTDLFCNLTKKESGVSYSVTISTKDSLWLNNVKNVSIINFSNLGLDFTSNTIYSYLNNYLLGYENLSEDSDLGLYSSPIVYINNVLSTSPIECRIIVKKSSSDFVEELTSNKEYLESILNDDVLSSSAVSYLLDIKQDGDMRLYSTFTMKNTESIIKSSFDNKNSLGGEILEDRLNTLENSCTGKSILSNDCMNSFEKIRFYNERAKKIYELNMELECRKDFNHINCQNYILEKGETGPASFINEYCGKVKNMLSKDCFKACSGGVSSVMNVCVKNTNIFLFILFIIYLVIFSYLRLRKFFKSKPLKEVNV